MREDWSQYQFQNNCQTGVLNGKIIGLFELPGNLTGQSDMEFFLNNLPNLLEEGPKAAERIALTTK